MATFTNELGVQKQTAREWIVNSIYNHEKDFLTLPADNCKIEKMILDKISAKCNFVMCERNPEIYRKLLFRIAKDFKRMPTLQPYEVSKLIYEAKENQYSNLILDYCGQIATFADEIKHAIDNNIVEVNGIIALTFAKRISKQASKSFVEEIEKLNKLSKNNFGDINESRTENAIITYISRICGLKYSLEKVFNYRDTSAMILIIIRRIK
jgi:hypothetical protein